MNLVLFSIFIFDSTNTYGWSLQEEKSLSLPSKIPLRSNTLAFAIINVWYCWVVMIFRLSINAKNLFFNFTFSYLPLDFSNAQCFVLVFFHGGEFHFYINVFLFSDGLFVRKITFYHPSFKCFFSQPIPNMSIYNCKLTQKFRSWTYR